MQQSIEIRVFFKSEKKIIHASFGKTLREALLENHMSPYPGKSALMNCRGLGVCGTCKVILVENNEKKEVRSCQIQCFKPLDIELSPYKG